MSEIVPIQQNQVPAMPSEIGYFTVAGFELLQRVGMLFNKSTVVPDSFKGNLSNCIIAVNMAMRMGCDPLMCMQNMYIVYGNPSFSSKFLIACFNNTGRYSSLRYEMTGKPGTDDWGCCAVATEKSTGEKLTGPLVTIKIAKAEGWYDKKGSKWQTMPELMLRYRAASQFIKLYAPEISMGMQTTEEVEDTIDLEVTPQGSYAPVAPPAEEKTVEVKSKEKPKTKKVADGIIAAVKEKLAREEVEEAKSEPSAPEPSESEFELKMREIDEWAQNGCSVRDDYLSAIQMLKNFVKDGKLAAEWLPEAEKVVKEVAARNGIKI